MRATRRVYGLSGLPFAFVLPMRARSRPGSVLVVRAVSALLAGLVLSGCSDVAPLRPEPVNTKLAAIPWPRNAVTIAVEDRRTEQTRSPELIKAVAGSILQALASERLEPCPCFALTVKVIEHRGFFRGGGSSFWHGVTALDATLADASGKDVYHFRAEDQDEKWNTLGRGSGMIAAQQSLRDAIRKLVRSMAQRELPGW